MSNNAQDIYIQGGGTLTDWAHLKKYEQNNSSIYKWIIFKKIFV